MRGTVYPLKSVREFWFARTASRIARRLTAINIREATTKDTFLTKLRCILLHSVGMTQKSPFDPQDHIQDNSIQQKYVQIPEFAHRNAGRAPSARYTPTNKW